MRMRFKPYAHDELMAADFHVHEPLIWGGRWHAQYARPEQPFVLELGCGKGGFISQLASAHPENNYLGIDITDKVLILAKRKIEAAYQEAGRPIDNVKIMSTDIERIKGVLTPEDTVSRIYINFCNPWSKNASSNKHRLTYPRQLIQYRDFLKDGGEIYFKTDDDDLFRDSLEYFPASGYDIEWMTYDLHENEPEWNIRTEHEGMFTEMGIKIKALIARKLPAIVTLFCAVVFACVAMLLVQPDLVARVAGVSSLDFMSGFKGVLMSCFGPTALPTGSAELDALVATRGMSGMLNTVWLIICAMCFGGVMTGSGMLRSLTSIFLRWVRRAFSAVASTVGAGLFFNLCTADQYISIILSGRLFRDLYADRGLEPRLLSRSVEDSATVCSVLIPWNSCGMTQATVLGVSTFVYAPYCIFNIVSPLMSLLVAAVGWNIKRKK